MIQIGAPLAHDFSNPLGVLSDCHRRIEHFLHLLIVVTEQAHGGTLSAEQRDALEVALRYFEEAEPKHNADEEESLFPRLRASRHLRTTEALAIVDALAADHEVARKHHARVGVLGQHWLADGCLPDAAAHELAARLDALTTLYRHHIPVEDSELLPLARSILSPEDIAALGREMAARRGIDTTRGHAAGGGACKNARPAPAAQHPSHSSR
jgi:hemerythrin-like domain-containing protein